MTIRNRELSQFGSFIYIDNTTKDIGITTGTTPYVGIGTTNAQTKFHVFGNSTFDGDVYFRSNIVGVTSFANDIYTKNISAGIVTATNLQITDDVIGIVSFTDGLYAENIDSGIISANEIYVGGSLLVDVELQTWIPKGDDVYRNIGNVGIGTSANLYKLSVNGQIESQAQSGTAPFVVRSTTVVPNLNASLLGGKNPPSGDIVGTTDTQTLIFKTINLTDNSLTGTTAEFNAALSDGNFVTLTGTETLTNKTLTSPIISSISNSGTQIIPTGNGTLISTNSVGIITSGMIGDLQIIDADISTTAAIKFSKISTTGIGNSITNANIADRTIQNIKLQNSSISGVSLGSSLSSLTPGTYVTGSAYNGSSAQTWNVTAYSSNTPSAIVARDANGDFSAGTITAEDFNATSDLDLKENIEVIENAVDILNGIDGVKFTWKRTGKQSFGVIAQELEKVLPELVKTTDVKSVNYNGLIAILIEAIKELSEEINTLKNNR